MLAPLRVPVTSSSLREPRQDKECTWLSILSAWFRWRKATIRNETANSASPFRQIRQWPKKCDWQVFPNFQSVFLIDDWIAYWAILKARNNHLQHLNDGVGSLISRTPQQFLSAVSAHEAKARELDYSVKLHSSITATASTDYHKVTLEKGYIVLSLRNLFLEMAR